MCQACTNRFILIQFPWLLLCHQPKVFYSFKSATKFTIWTISNTKFHIARSPDAVPSLRGDRHSIQTKGSGRAIFLLLPQPAGKIFCRSLRKELFDNFHHRKHKTCRRLSRIWLFLHERTLIQNWRWTR